MRRPVRHVSHSSIPTVNLLSPWVFDAIATRRLRQRFAAAAALLVILVGAGWTVQHMRVGDEREVLVAKQAETTRLTLKTQELEPVQMFIATVDQQMVTVKEAMEGELYMSRVLTGLQLAAREGADVETLAITLPPPVVPVTAPAPAEGEDAAPAPPEVPVVSPCPGPDPFNTRVVVGCVELTGSAASRAIVGDFVIRLGNDALFVEPFISTTTSDGDDVLFTGSVGLSTKAYTSRYAAIKDLLKQGGGR
jgi:hypothetical protein